MANMLLDKSPVAVAPRLPTLTAESALAAARALTPRIRARAAETEAARTVHPDNIADLLDAGLFGIATPKRFGGSELGVQSMVEVSTEIAAACGSTGWVFGVLSGHNWMTALFSEQAQEEIFADPRTLVSSVFRLEGTVVPVSGGYCLTGGLGRFSSGVDYADWVLVGNAVKREGAAPEGGFFLVPKCDVEIVDDWFTAGMRGTGSRSIRISETVIPEHRFIRMTDIQRGETPGAKLHGKPAYRLPFALALPFNLIGAPLGMARCAIADFAEGLSKKLGSQPPEQIGEQSASFARLSGAAVEVESAYRLILEDARRIDAASDPSVMTPLDRATVKRNAAFAAQRCRYAVTSVFEASGGSGIYDGSTVQRSWRDVNAATAHVAFGWDTAATNYGRTLAGLPPSRFAMI